MYLVHIKIAIEDWFNSEPAKKYTPWIIKYNGYFFEFGYKLKQKFEATFREAYKVLKPNARISIVAPIFSTVDGGDITINMDEIARKYNFKAIPLLDLNRIVNKSNQKLQFQQKHVKSMIDAKKGQIVKRKIYVFEKVN